MKEGLVTKSTLEVLEGYGKKNNNRYFLTAGGSKAKTELRTFFIKARMQEYQNWHNRLLENLLEIQHKGVSRVLVLGSQNLTRLLAHIARSENLDISIIGTASTVDQFGCFNIDAFDIILIADVTDQHKKLLREKKISERLVTFLK
jgi:hypothetical protein